VEDTVLTPVVHEDSAKVSNDVNHEKDGAILAFHGKIAATCITFNGVALRKRVEPLKYSLRGSKDFAAGICGEGEYQEDDEKNDGMNIVSKKGSFCERRTRSVPSHMRSVHGDLLIPPNMV
jgi:hypothetical protein